jgi:predicted transcriptional regulator
MLDLSNSLYFLPNKDFRHLSILLAMYHNPELSQHGIATQANLSGAMVNGYVKKMKQCGLVNILQKNKRDNVYVLTSSGKTSLMKCLIGCSTELVQLFSQLRDELQERLHSYFTRNDSRKIILFGGANTAQLVLSAIDPLPYVSIEAIVDNDSSKWGKSLGKNKIQSPEIMDELDFDCVVISSYACQNEIYETISHLLKKNVSIVKLSSI